MEASRGFRALMLKMVRVETERNYEELWKEYNKELLGEPFLPSKFRVKDNTAFSMSPEFQIVVAQKKADVGECVSKIGGGEAANSLISHSQSARSEEIDLEADIELKTI